jgi:Ca2+-binding RTX toxin-like protein
MPVLTTDSIQTGTYGLAYSSAQTWTIAAGVTCASDIFHGVYDGAYGGRLINLGTVVSDANWAVSMSGTNATVINAALGVIAGTQGVAMEGYGATVTNHGMIVGFDGPGVRLYDDAVLTNTGEITGTTSAVEINGAAVNLVEIINSGTISSSSTIAIYIWTYAAVVITNSGTIDTPFANCITSEGPGPVAISNFGFIQGVLLGEADDGVYNAGTMRSVLLGGGADVYYGAESDLGCSVSGDVGNDTLTGGVDDDALFGDVDNDILSGGRGDDTLDGGSGKDKLTGGRDDDALTGGLKGDTFVFRPGFGHDTITDFAASGSNHDVIKLGHDLFADYADVSASMTQAGADVLITADNGDTILVLNVTVASMVAADFELG